jgi:hypothetical protein
VLYIVPQQRQGLSPMHFSPEFFLSPAEVSSLAISTLKIPVGTAIKTVEKVLILSRCAILAYFPYMAQIVLLLSPHEAILQLSTLF